MQEQEPRAIYEQIKKNLPHLSTAEKLHLAIHILTTTITPQETEYSAEHWQKIIHKLRVIAMREESQTIPAQPRKKALRDYPNKAK